MTRMKQYSKNNEFVLTILCALLFLGFAIGSPYFLRSGNMISLLTQFVELGLLTLAMSASILSGGFDMSIGTMTSMLTVILATLMGPLGWPPLLALPVALIIALLCGALNGFLCGYLKLAPMLATIGTMSLFTGVGMVISKGNTVNCLVPSFYLFGQGKLFGVIPMQFLIFLFAAAAAIVIFNHSRFGRRIYLLGTSAEVSRFTGVKCEKNIALVYVFDSVMCFLCAVILTSRMCSGRADVGDPMVLQSVSAAVFGGISIKGGAGNIIGAILGVIVFSLISNGMNLLGVSAFVQQIIQGALLLGILTFRVAMNKR